ncbi:hypothetical protein ATZ33_13570 [Enterococcus silesiacus]|uniref:DUF1433 domain-containing protein n=1 Tax=Enterococcus silesiacus TaxID=332949 RepID=A0A0S3KE93_9ENTE|nr:DUF1433 domain-containing protein [Enterococcus silesiacus]ALS02377.1 hypothetical protein ATZ33_13570 [Enterococcus silesiacus]OJG91352.1 hypothetical protein RV15_GL000808 [Enterococcus silesiacus]
MGKNKDIDIQKKRIEEYVRYNYNNIESITFTDSKKVPTGSTYVHGYINEKKNLSFSAWLTPNTFEGEFTNSPELDQLSKYEKNKLPNEIEKEQQVEENNINQSSTWFSDKYSQ